MSPHRIVHHGEVAPHHHQSLVAAAGAPGRILHLQHHGGLITRQFGPVIGAARPRHPGADDDGAYRLGQSRLRTDLPGMIGQGIPLGEPDRRLGYPVREGHRSEGFGDGAEHLPQCPTAHAQYPDRPCVLAVGQVHVAAARSKIVPSQPEEQTQAHAQAPPQAATSIKFHGYSLSARRVPFMETLAVSTRWANLSFENRSGQL